METREGSSSGAGPSGKGEKVVKVSKIRLKETFMAWACMAVVEMRSSKADPAMAEESVWKVALAVLFKTVAAGNSWMISYKERSQSAWLLVVFGWVVRNGF